MALKIVFMGTPDFSVPALEAIAAAGHDVVAVYSQPPRPAGRGMAERPSPVHAKAASLSIPVYTPRSLKVAEEQTRFADLSADAAVVIAYGLILPAAVLAAPRLGCFNVHASALPRWRGAAPIQRAIMAGDRETAVMVMRIDEGFDTGPVGATDLVPIPPDMTASELHDELSRRDVGANRHAALEPDGARVETFLHAHHHDGGFRIARHDGALDRCRAAPTRQRGGVHVEAAEARGGEDGWRQEEAVGDDDSGVGAEIGKELLLFGVLQCARCADGDFEGFGLGLNG